MKHPSQHKVEKAHLLVRGLAFLMMILSLIATLSLFVVALDKPLAPPILIGAAITGLMLHISAYVAWKGEVPKYLLFAHGLKKNTQ